MRLKIYLISALSLIGCQHPIANMPPLDIQIYQGWPETQSIVRKQGIGSSIECKQTEFRDYMCVSQKDFMKIYDTMLQCKDWGTKP